MFILIISLFLSSPLLAERFTADPTSRSFEIKKPVKHRVDVFDFSGDLPQLETIDIDATRKKNVEFNLTGDCPLLEAVNYTGSFGILKGELTGNFPLLSQVTFACTNCAIELDLTADWQRSCDITITGADEDIVLKLPKNVGLIIQTKVSAKGKVLPCEGLKKINRLGIFNKTYENDLVGVAPVTLTLVVHLTEGHLVLN